MGTDYQGDEVEVTKDIKVLLAGEDITNDVLKVEQRNSFSLVTADTQVKGSAGFLHGFQRNKFFYVFTSGIPTNIREICDDIYKRNIYSLTGLVSKWSFNDVATDSVGANNLTLTGSPSYSTQAPMIARSQA